ncbi:hypothetical protein M409DRAFT_65208 [Zasmidium cellare ATCC 36951]|uniref:Nudix hydrolase domain-containing protein n=1 Tax=Zasmidium cellare ATCC 36951 TaxID=1080233 RepID=A0A6A6CP42_ZASCE|nr:uncharacterized protein M409DRAFT_65208 [Zasmidium cellare ATCC 36951]KAF2168831.1 hypothetical protein M409DRAFT_65208 [Zasmidium cellare ATCC 36951]
MASTSTQVRVGVGVFILENRGPSTSQNPRFLIGKRKGSHGAGTYALPGGHLEFGESFEECAEREVKEETGLDVKSLAFFTATNDVMQEDGRHYVTVFMVCEREDGKPEPVVMEEDKCEGWEWCEWSELAEMVGGKREGKLFLPLVDLVNSRPGLVPALERAIADEAMVRR